MAITPADIQAQTFSEAKRGYDPAEVDVFLETLSSEVDAMLAKIVDLKGRLTATEQQLADTQAQLAQAQDAAAQAVPAASQWPLPAPDFSAQERQISAALIAAQQTAEGIVNDANENAERIRNEADAKAREVIRQALTEKQAELEEIDRLKASREEFKAEVPQAHPALHGRCSELLPGRSHGFHAGRFRRFSGCDRSCCRAAARRRAGYPRCRSLRADRQLRRRRPGLTIGLQSSILVRSSRLRAPF